MTNVAKESLISKCRSIAEDAQSLLDHLATAQEVSTFVAAENAELRRLLRLVLEDESGSATTARKQAAALLGKKAALIGDFLFQELAAAPAQDASAEPTKFVIVSPTAQIGQPKFDRRTRLFTADGLEIIGCVSYSVEGGDRQDLMDGLKGLRTPIRIKLEFPLDQFTIKS